MGPHEVKGRAQVRDGGTWSWSLAESIKLTQTRELDGGVRSGQCSPVSQQEHICLQDPFLGYAVDPDPDSRPREKVLRCPDGKAQN